MLAGQERGWFDKYAKYFTTYYQFQDGQFAMFEAITTSFRASPMAMREEAPCLLSPAKTSTT